MPGLFSECRSRLPKSSSGHRNTQRLNAGLQIVGQLANSTIDASNPAASLPITFAQTLVSASSVIRDDTHGAEKFVHLLQAILAAGETGLAITLIAMHEICTSNDINSICTAFLILKILYGATLLVTWLPSEASKEDSTQTDVVTNNAV